MRIKAGRIDGNSEFAALHSAESFINSSMGYSPTILLFPSYPTPSAGVVVGLRPAAFLDATFGTLSVEDDEERAFIDPQRNRFVIGQLTGRWTLDGARLDGTLTVGLWRHTGAVRRFDGHEQKGVTGPYVTFEQTVWRERGGSAGREDERHIQVFLQYGHANPYIAELERHIGVGLVMRGPFPSGRDDLLGLAMTMVRMSDRCPNADAGGRETVWGPFYEARITPWLSAQPDLQIIVRREPDGGRRWTVAATSRLVVSF